jgi:acyl-CoA synthetase (AMP-forming)/AMP-acid ligase II
MRLVQQLAVLALRGVLSPGRPDRVLRQVLSLRQWGYGLGGEVRQAAARSPAAVAVLDEERGEVTFAQLLEGSERAAAVLRSVVGEAERPRVGVLCRNHLGMVEVLAGASASGIDVVLVNTGLSAEQVHAVAREQGLALLVHDRDFAAVVVGAPCPLLDEDELVRRQQAVTAAELAGSTPPTHRGRTIVLTSGTTGTPKGAHRPHPKGFSALASILDRIPFRPGGRVLLAAPIFHTWGLAGLQLCLGLRSTMVLQRRFDAESARGALRRHRCDAMFAVPVMAQRLLALPSDGLDATGHGDGGARRGRLGGDQLKVVALSGSALPAGFATRFMADYGPVLHNLYGSTEASWVAVADPADLAADPACAGRPPRGTLVAIVDDQGDEVADGEVGRIFVGNDMVFDGYTHGGARPSWRGLVATGDLGRWVARRLHVEGREDDLVVCGGENVYPSEIEAAIESIPEVLEVCAFGVPDDEYGQRVVAAVVLQRGASLRPEEIVECTRLHVARHAVPREVRLMAELPRNATGKVLVSELRQPYDDA